MNNLLRRWGWLLLALSLCLPPAVARAHGGGKLQIGNAPVGECLVSVWSAPTTPRTGDRLHLTVGLAEAGTEAPVLNGQVRVWLTAVDDGERVAEAEATTAQSVNKLFYEADLPPLPAGTYGVTVETICLGETGMVDFGLDVRPSVAPIWVVLPLAGGGLLLGWLLLRAWRQRGDTAVTIRKKPSL